MGIHFNYFTLIIQLVYLNLKLPEFNFENLKKMKSFISVLIGSILSTTVLAFPNSFRDDQMKFNQTEVNQLIHDLTLIRPVLSNTFQELNDYIFTNYGLDLLHRINRTKSIPSGEMYNEVKNVIEEHSHYLKIIVTDPNELMKMRNMEKQFREILVKLYNLRPKLIEKNLTEGIEIISEHIIIDEKLVHILKRNLTYDQEKVESLMDTANYAIEKYSKQVKLY